MIVAILVLACAMLLSAIVTAAGAKRLPSDPRMTWLGVYAWALLTCLLGGALVVLTIVALNTIPSPHG